MKLEKSQNLVAFLRLVKELVIWVQCELEKVLN